MMLSDVGYALRLLRRNPGFTAVAVITIALGIGVNIAIFSLADGMLFRSLPYRDADRLVLIQGFNPKSSQAYSRVLRVDFEQLREHHSGLEDIAVAADRARFTWTGTAGAEAISATEATPNLLGLLGVGAHLGRPLQPGDDEIQPAPAMLRYGSWQRRFGGDPSVIGRTLTFDQGTVQIVGILPERFIYPLQLASGELLLATGLDPKNASNPREGVWTPVARLRDNVSLEQAQTETDVLVNRAAAQFPETSQDRALRVANLQYALFELSRTLLWILLSAAAFVLLIASVNIASLLLARGTDRQRELGVRQAIGASRWRLARQLLVESLALSALGGTAALLVGWVTFGALASLVPSRFQLLPNGLDPRSVLFGLLVTVLAGLLFGIAPAVRFSTPDLSSLMKIGSAGARGRRIRVGSPLVAAEMALGLILLTGAGLMVNSLIRMRTVDLGIDPDGLLTMTYSLPQASFPTGGSRLEHSRALVDGLRRQRGFQSVAAIESPQTTRYAPPRAIGGEAGRRAGLWGVSSGYFATVRLPLVDGRDFTDAEERAQAPVVVVNESLARMWWPEQRAVGRQLAVDGLPALTVIGIVRDARPGYGAAVQLAAFRPLPSDLRLISVLARVDGDVGSLAALMRTEAQRLAPGAIVPRPQLLTDSLAAGIAENAFQTGLFAVFGLLGLLVCVVGVYGVTGYTVGARVREMGIRLALGARPEQLKRLIVAQSAIPLVVGLMCGLGGAWILSRQLESLLYEVRARDAATYIVVFSTLVIAGLVAAYLPARRAARIDPIIALRAD